MSFQIKTFNAIAEEGLKRLDPTDFIIDSGQEPDAIILRSENLHAYDFPKTVKAVSRAGAGVNNIPIEECTKQGIVVFNTPGANANAVKELVLASLILSVRPILKGAQWLNTLVGDDISEQVEAHKKRFAGRELSGKKLGVVGLGAIGAMIANDAYRLGMDVVGYDPYVSVDTAWAISRRVQRALSLEEILSTCDFITIHIPLNEKTRDFIAVEQLKLMKSTACLLNFSRGELVNTAAVTAAVAKGDIREYITDFADQALLNKENIVVLPHLGASTAEAELNCAKMASQNVKVFLKTGNIQHAVNLPNVELTFNSPYRLAIFHRNVPNMLGAISSTAAELGINIDNLINRSRDTLAYTLLDLTEDSYQNVAQLQQAVGELPDVIRIRIIKNKEMER